MVLGAGGAGKSTLAVQLGRILKLPVVHLDVHYWRPGWVVPEPQVWDRQLSALVAQDEWVMDGNYGRTIELRLPRAEAVILLDPPTIQCLWGAIQRGLATPSTRRPDLADGCSERPPSPDFLRYIANYKRKSRPRVFEKVSRFPEVPLIHLRSRRAAARFLDGVAARVTQ